MNAKRPKKKCENFPCVRVCFLVFYKNIAYFWMRSIKLMDQRTRSPVPELFPQLGFSLPFFYNNPSSDRRCGFWEA